MINRILLHFAVSLGKVSEATLSHLSAPSAAKVSTDQKQIIVSTFMHVISIHLRMCMEGLLIRITDRLFFMLSLELALTLSE